MCCQLDAALAEQKRLKVKADAAEQALQHAQVCMSLLLLAALSVISAVLTCLFALASMPLLRFVKHAWRSSQLSSRC